MEYIGYWPQTKDDQLSPAQTTAKVKFILYNHYVGNAVAQLVEALRYKPEVRGFDSRWCQWNLSLT
jgi:hypothetical protein